MSEPFLGEIKMFAGNYAPRGYAFCWGQLLSIQQNQALFALLGTTYGGNGQTNFALPDLRGRAPMHHGQGPGLSPRSLGEMNGAESVTLLASQLPMHTHAAQASTAAVSNAFGPGSAPGASATTNFYGSGAPQVAMAPQAVDAAGGGQPHDNMGPYLALNFIIATQGIFPARN